jgi:predicted DNA-binding transcriptional regulator AlpA
MNDVVENLKAAAKIDPVFPTPEALSYVGRSERWLYEAKKQGHAPQSVKISRGRLGYRKSELDKIFPGGRAAYLNDVEAAKALGVPRRRLHTYRAKGVQDPAWIRFGGLVFYPKAQFSLEQLARVTGEGPEAS